MIESKHVDRCLVKGTMFHIWLLLRHGSPLGERFDHGILRIGEFVKKGINASLGLSSGLRYE